MSKVEITTKDGICPAYVSKPSGAGPWPVVLVYMDGLGIRPEMLEVGEKLAAHGYWALLPDLFYRSGPYAPMDAKKVFSDPEARKELMAKFALAAPAMIMADTASFFDFIASDKDARKGGIATTGYCMGGLMSLTCAGTYGDRIAVSASFHGSRLASDQPDSPHLLAPKMKAKVYVAGAIEDQSFPDDMKERLEKALTDAHVDHTIETYPAKHGWVFSDTPVYDEAQSKRHYDVMFELFDSVLKKEKRSTSAAR